MDFYRKTVHWAAAILVIAVLFGGRVSANELRFFLTSEETELLVRSAALAAGGSMRIDGRDNIKSAAPYAARVGILATVLNRLEDSRFPNSVPQIIASDKTFSGTAPAVPISDYDMKLTYAALDAALRGFDPTNGALYFSTPTAWVNEFIVTSEMDGYAFGIPAE